MTLRKCSSRSVADLKSEQNLKSLIQKELRELINGSVHDYLQRNKIPIATIDINVDKECNHCNHNGPRESSRAVRLNISTSSMEFPSESNKEDNDIKYTQSKPDDNRHWMTWVSTDDSQFNTKSKNLRNYRCLTTMAGNEHRCLTPFSRPNTTTGHRIDNFDYKERSQRFRSSSNGPPEHLRFAKVDKVIGTPRPRTSIAVGPDKHYEDRGTNTHKSYQVSDYLKKNMDLNDPYERNVYSSLMEVMKKKTYDESTAGTADPVIQVSEYKYRFQNPRSKVVIPTSSNQTLASVKKPPLCPHKSRPLGQLRPQSSCTQKFRTGEQFLY